MKITKLELPVMSSWMEDNGRRLDSKPYLSGALEARVILNKLPVKKEPLQNLTQNGMAGIFIAPYFKRVYVEDANHGIPLLGNNDIIAADLSNTSLLSRKVFERYKSGLELKEGWTLITCFGTVGKMAYCSSDISKCAGSTNFMRIVPDTEKILSGYLYAFISSKFGVTLVVEQETGSIIPNLLPHHIADLPVPRLGKEIEEKAHYLVSEAARIRTDANSSLDLVIRKFENYFNLPNLPRSFQKTEPDISVASSNLLSSRLDALFHSNYHKSALEPLLNLHESKRITVGVMAHHVFEPNRLKRVPLDNADHGIPFFGTSALMWLEPKAIYYIPQKTPGIKNYIVDEKTLLIPRSGQLAGIIGHVVFPHGSVIGGAVTEDAIRIKTNSTVIAGYLFIALSSEYGKRQLKARAFGSSIPHIDVHMIKETIIPLLSEEQIQQIGIIGYKIAQARSEAIDKEQQARRLVEEFIELEGGA